MVRVTYLRFERISQRRHGSADRRAQTHRCWDTTVGNTKRSCHGSLQMEWIKVCFNYWWLFCCEHKFVRAFQCNRLQLLCCCSSLSWLQVRNERKRTRRKENERCTVPYRVCRETREHIRIACTLYHVNSQKEDRDTTPSRPTKCDGFAIRHAGSHHGWASGRTRTECFFDPMPPHVTFIMSHSSCHCQLYDFRPCDKFQFAFDVKHTGWY